MYAFTYGVILALGLIIPLGVQNIFLFNQGANQKTIWKAMPSVITAIICDVILIISAILGVSMVVFAIPLFKTLLFLFGFFFLLYMGFVSWFSQPKRLYEGQAPLSARKQVLFTMSVSLLNPHALLDTMGVMGTSALQFVGWDRVIFTVACIIVSIFWFTGLTISGHYLQKLDNSGRLLLILNKISAVIIWVVAIYIGRLLIQSF